MIQSRRHIGKGRSVQNSMKETGPSQLGKRSEQASCGPPLGLPTGSAVPAGAHPVSLAPPRAARPPPRAHGTACIALLRASLALWWRDEREAEPSGRSG